ncbi:penicillin-binding transpeptidase domain-containing protein [Nocardiopsis alba]|uniref:penicillin-binding transpeptidase domain-containing protein n=1 Tax=Nocardiopsis alba TaxID=53437 RepID=UPI00366F0F44
MRTDTESAPRRSRRTRGYALTAGCALTLFTGVACGGAEEEGEPDRSAVGEPVELGDVEAVERGDLESLFEEAGVAGTFVLYDANGRSAVLVGADGAHERAVPGTTFELPNTLIALQTGAVSDVDETISPDRGEGRSLRADLSADGTSVHHEVAERIGHERMSTWVDRFDYGNRGVGDEDDLGRFWAEGPLEISALEQATFLAGLARAELPVDVEHQEALRELVALEEGSDYRLFGPTGHGEDDDAHGWWVGWVERSDELHTFALRLDEGSEGDAELRESLGREFLVELDVLPGEAAEA